jgi:uncharacterized protein
MADRPPRGREDEDRLRNHAEDARLSRIVLLLAAVFAIVATIVGLAGEARAAPRFPPLSGRVVDEMRLLPPERAARLEAELAALEEASGRQLVVASVRSLEGLEIEDYGYQLGRAWGIGSKERNDGAILLVAPNERKVRIEVGYGLEGVLTDALTSQVIRREIIPQFKAGDMAAGMERGAAELVRLLQLPPDEAEAAALAARQQDEDEGTDFIAVLAWVLIIIIWIAIASASGPRGRRRGSAVIWGAGTGGSWGGGSWGGGGGGWGGGGFSGGGGSFGGGGSSGSW